MLLYDLLTEAPVLPGERKEIHLNFYDISYRKNKAKKYLENLYYLKDRLGYLESSGLLTNKDAYLGKLKDLVDETVAELNAQNQNESIKFNNVIKAIKKNCSEIVAAYTNTGSFLYRGMTSGSDAIYGKPYDTRKPKDSGEEYNLIFNHMLKKGGIKARRDNSIFCSSSKDQTEGYGTVYIIFPKDGFHHSYSQNTKDLVLDRGSFHRLFDKEKISKLYEELIENKKVAAEINPEWNSNYRMQDKSIVGTLGFFGEWYWYDDRAAIIEAAARGKIPEEYIERVKFTKLITPESVIKNFKISDKDIEDAIRSENEVVISGAYFAIKAKYENEIREALGMDKGLQD